GPPKFHLAIGAQFRQMLRQRRLAQLHDADKFSHRHLAAHSQKAKDQQALFVGEHFQELRGVAGLLRKLIERHCIAGAGGELSLFGYRRAYCHNFISGVAFRACAAQISIPLLLYCLELTKLANVDTGSKKQEIMRRNGHEGKKTCGMTRYAAKLFSRSLSVRLRRWGGAAFWDSA